MNYDQVDLLCQILEIRNGFKRFKATPYHISVILAVGHKSGKGTAAIMQALGISHKNFNQKINPAIRAGYIVKTNDKKFYLTEKGKEVFHEVNPSFQKVVETFSLLLITKLNKPTLPTSSLIQQCKDLSNQGLTQRKIAKILNISKSSVNRNIRLAA